MSSSHWLQPTTGETHVRFISSICLGKGAQDEPAPNLDRQRNQWKFTMYAVLGTAVAVAVMIGVLVAFADPVPGKEPDYVQLGLICLGLPLVAGAITYFACGNNNQAREEREQAMRSLCDRVDHFNYAGRTEFDDYYVGTVPWFATEEWKHAYGMMGGQLADSDFFILDCDQIVDPILSSTDSKLVQGAAQLMSKRHQRLYRSEMEAVLFSQPLENFSDLVIVPRRDPNRAYYKRSLHGQPCDVAAQFKLPRPLRNKYWIGAADPAACADALTDELRSLLCARDWCIVQVVGGYCTVFTSQWHGNRPGKAPKTETEIAKNIEFAIQVFDHLRHASERMTEAADVEEDYVPLYTPGTDQTAGATATATCSTPATVKTMAAAVRPKPAGVQPIKLARRRRHSLPVLLLLFGLGIPLGMLGTLCTMAASMDMQRGEAARAWPQVQGKIIRSEIETNRDSDNVESYKPDVQYEYEVNQWRYTNDKIIYGVEQGTEDKAEVEQAMSEFLPDAEIQVYYCPDDPRISTLQPGLENASVLHVIRYFGVGAMLVAIVMCGYGFVGRKRELA